MLLGDELVVVHHIGSTSVAGLPAKPIIDLLPVVQDIHRIGDLIPALEDAGYQAWRDYGLAGRRPGDDFNTRGDVVALLKKHGWQLGGVRSDGNQHWTRPGQSHGTARRRNVFCVLADGLDVLRGFPRPIDLLYLDGPHPDRENGRQWHLEAYRAATLAERSVLLIDDTDLPQHGKAELVLPAAIEDGFKLIACDRQALLVR